MITQAEEKRNYTPEEYLELEVNSEEGYGFLASASTPTLMS